MKHYAVLSSIDSTASFLGIDGVSSLKVQAAELPFAINQRCSPPPFIVCWIPDACSSLFLHYTHCSTVNIDSPPPHSYATPARRHQPPPAARPVTFGARAGRSLSLCIGATLTVPATPNFLRLSPAIREPRDAQTEQPVCPARASTTFKLLPFFSRGKTPARWNAGVLVPGRAMGTSPRL